ncbi:unnamed protein product [Cyprideis torosa]|uniref:Uncharacterized protein n=1 Tax=Cyprideis torosa TaxID=163714 RepID=A0A7R8ZMG0_9CRUS|nr:unnamed protein product [Cyprideis torosa]CAG0885729.1 unnamed protein product [Cyprideis torosa]
MSVKKKVANGRKDTDGEPAWSDRSPTKWGGDDVMKVLISLCRVLGQEPALAGLENFNDLTGSSMVELSEEDLNRRNRQYGSIIYRLVQTARYMHSGPPLQRRFDNHHLDNDGNTDTDGEPAWSDRSPTTWGGDDVMKVLISLCRVLGQEPALEGLENFNDLTGSSMVELSEEDLNRRNRQYGSIIYRLVQTARYMHSGPPLQRRFDNHHLDNDGNTGVLR